jgi:hypothetical protein
MGPLGGIHWGPLRGPLEVPLGPPRGPIIEPIIEPKGSIRAPLGLHWGPLVVQMVQMGPFDRPLWVPVKAPNESPGNQLGP